MSDRVFIIERRLINALTPDYLKITDDSHLHQGHAGAKTGAGHFTVEISAKQFNGKKTLECHRLIYQALDGLIPKEIHALRIVIKNEP